MEETLTIRLASETKEEMADYKLNWSEDIHNYIESKLKKLKMLKTLEKMKANAKSMKVKIDSTDIIREYRDAR